MSHVEHDPPRRGSLGLARVVFEVAGTADATAEAMWGDWIEPSVLRLDNIPLLVFGVSRGDEVRVSGDGEPWHFDAVLRRGGHSTYRVMLNDDDPAGRTGLRDLASMGCGTEALTPRFVAVDVPPHVDVAVVYSLLERGMDAGVWTFEEGHCGHDLGRG